MFRSKDYTIVLVREGDGGPVKVISSPKARDQGDLYS